MSKFRSARQRKARIEATGAMIAVAVTDAVIVVPAALAGAPFWACWVAGTLGWLLCNCTYYAARALGFAVTTRR